MSLIFIKIFSTDILCYNKLARLLVYRDTLTLNVVMTSINFSKYISNSNWTNKCNRIRNLINQRNTK